MLCGTFKTEVVVEKLYVDEFITIKTGYVDLFITIGSECLVFTQKRQSYWCMNNKESYKGIS